MLLKRARDRSKALIEVTVKVPAERVAEVREIAAEWCREDSGGRGVTSDNQLSMLD
jgi:hypothetical protein